MMDYQALLLITICASGLIATRGYDLCPRDVDPCNPEVYLDLDEPDRSTGFPVESVSDNDYTHQMAWYRSVSGAGGDMPTEPVETGQCNAYAPIWLTEPLPDVADGIKDIRGCATFLYDYCVRNYTIPVKNCGIYNVYCLYPVDDTYDRFCMGSEVECPEGFTSENGFTPDCDIPVTTTTTSTTTSTTTTTPTTTTILEAFGSCPTDIDPCDPDVYQELNDPSRSAGHTGAHDFHNDYIIEQNWYRSVSGAGGNMPTETAMTGQCGALAPIWINGDLPHPWEGIVDVLGCASFLNNTCSRHYHIPMKNCGSFSVYCLYPVMDTYDRFCMGTETECPSGYYSATGFTPGCTRGTEEPTSTTVTQTSSTTPVSTTPKDGVDDGSDKDSDDNEDLVIGLSVFAAIILLILALLIAFIAYTRLCAKNDKVDAYPSLDTKAKPNGFDGPFVITNSKAQQYEGVKKAPMENRVQNVYDKLGVKCPDYTQHVYTDAESPPPPQYEEIANVDTR